MYIHQFSVSNYRSLKNINVGDLSSAVILYGENNSGKSNILSFLDMVFRQKYTDEVTQTPDGKAVQMKSRGFWTGQIIDFSNNFYLNNLKPITFSLLIKIGRPELLGIKGLPKKFVDSLPKNRKDDVLIIEGQIASLGVDRAEMSLVRAEFNQKIFYNATTKGPEFLPAPEFNTLSLAEKTNVFDSIFNMLDNAFLRIPPDRFLSEEQEEHRDQKVELSSKTLKNWLFQSSHDQNAEKTIREIARQFNTKPFNYGNISIVRVGKNEIEVFVEGKGGLKLPIGRNGSGVQQILTILSYITQANSPIIGIEELEINLSPNTQRVLITNLLELINSESTAVRQIIFTTHSPHIGKRNEAQRRCVSMENGETKVTRPSEAETTGFFRV